jgi:predicted transcriptional regulator
MNRNHEERELQTEMERMAALASEFESECQKEIKNRAEDEAQFWNMVYILAHVAAAALVLFTLYNQWGKQC